jgi:hypothetical protein
MSVSYELLFLHSIPFLARVGDSLSVPESRRANGSLLPSGGGSHTDKSRKLYYYDAKHISDGTEPIAIGSYDNGAVKLDEGWQLRLQPRVDAWKGTLTSSERGIIQPRAPKPSKPKRTSPKATTAGTTEGNVIVLPDATGGGSPPSTKGRRRGVRTNAKAAL